jgi:phenylacetic acid degradation operon negative regulatory protein
VSRQKEDVVPDFDPMASDDPERVRAEFDITAASARSAIHRLATRGILVATKSGRNTLYRLSEPTEEVGHRNAPEVFAFARESLSAWDGRWRVACFTIPESRRQTRSGLRSTLRSHGYAPIQDGVWVSARPHTDALLTALQEFDEPSLVLFEADLVHPPQFASRLREAVAGAGELAADYTDFIARHTPTLERARAAAIPPAHALVLRVELMDEWRGLYRRDPRMPLALLPPDWPLAQAGTVFNELYDRLAPLAQLRIDDLLAEFDLPDEARPRAFVSQEVLARRQPN